MNNTDVLYQPFDIEVHKKEFINYLEVVIDEHGRVHYAVPSHQEKLIKLACMKHGMTRDELNDACPEAYYFNFITWLCIMSGCVSIWNDYMIGQANEKQAETIQKLADAGLYHGLIIMKKDSSCEFSTANKID